MTKRDLTQWFFRITSYADELLDFSKLEWPERVMAMQRNWIGRSEGAELTFVPSEGSRERADAPCFTTRPDTVFGVTFLVLAPEHPLVDEITTPENREAEVDEYVARARRQTEIDRLAVDGTKTGVSTGAFCLHPFTGERVPIFIADYVLVSYGTGAVMGVPAHDQRDFSFATRQRSPD